MHIAVLMLCSDKLLSKCGYEAALLLLLPAATAVGAPIRSVLLPLQEPG